MKNCLYIILIVIIFFSSPVISQQKQHKWERIGGKWLIENSFATEIATKIIPWNYLELHNYNSIVSLNSYNNYMNFEIKARIFEREQSPAEFIIAFAVTSESQAWFYHLYAFKITGGYWGMNKVSLIYSDREDRTKPFGTKNNFFVKELASVDCKVKYGEMYDYTVTFEGDNVTLSINNQRILTAPFPEKNHNGRIALGSKNAKLSVDRVAVKNGDKIIFEDEFDIDSIYVRTLKATRVPQNVEVKPTDKTNKKTE